MRNLLLSLILMLPLFGLAQKQRIWIDTDIMIGKFGQDVDDGLALLMLLQDSSVQIEGISFVGKVDYGKSITEKLLANYASEMDIPLFVGARDSGQFKEITEAVTGITAALKKGPLTIMALGPMTNIASVLELYPEVKGNVKQISFCGGRRPGQVLNPGDKGAKFSDYNFDLDPYSAAMVLKANVPVLLAGYDCADTFFLSKKDFVHLKTSQNKMDRWLFRKMKTWNGLWKMFSGTKKGFIPFDCATVGTLLYPYEFQLTPFIPAYIKVRDNDTKNTVKSKTKPYLEVDANEAGRIVSYCDETKTEFKSRLLKVLNHPDYQ